VDILYLVYFMQTERLVGVFERRGSKNRYLNNTNKWQMGFNSAFKGLNSNQYRLLSQESLFSIGVAE
jgi:hypothetical protein